MLLHNREDLVNFDQVLGISSLHGEKSPNFFFKLLILKDFAKYHQLKFRYLTAWPCFLSSTKIAELDYIR